MVFGLGWIRRRQRSLTRGVLALVCATWLQAAVVPCVMAHDAGGAPPQASGHAHHDGHSGHDHAAATARADGHDAVHPCPYCPPGESGAADCGAHGCAYPHDPQVDARLAGAIFAALPVSFVVPLAGTSVVAGRQPASSNDGIPRVSLSVSYCRFIE